MIKTILFFKLFYYNILFFKLLQHINMLPNLLIYVISLVISSLSKVNQLNTTMI